MYSEIKMHIKIITENDNNNNNKKDNNFSNDTNVQACQLKLRIKVEAKNVYKLCSVPHAELRIISETIFIN